MRERIRFWLPLCGAAAVVGLLTGCSDSEKGSPATVASVPPLAGSGSSAPDGGTAVTADLEPCTLLTAPEITEFGSFEEQPREDSGLGARSCSYLPARGNGSTESRPTVGVDIRDEQGVSAVNDAGDGIRQGTVGDREAARTSGPGGCIIAMAVGGASRVDVAVTGIDAGDACDIANEVADIVEPKLPEG
ncbi:DUF3558 family protein [Saccharomonospora sp. NPDC006951]